MDLEEPDDSDDDFSLAEEELPKSRSIRSTGSRSPSTSSPASTSTSESTSLRGDNATETGEDLQANGGGKRSSEVETEEDPIDPITPHAATFPEQGIVKRPKVRRENTIPGGFEYEDDGDDEDLGVDGEGDIEDDWVDSGLITPPSVLSSEVEAMKVESMTSEGAKSRSKSKSKSGSKHRDENKERRPSKSKSRRPDITSKTVPIVETTTATIAQHYPFPSSITGEAEKEDDKKGEDGKRIPQMRTTKARDGGRTQSGGVRGVLLTDDGDDF